MTVIAYSSKILRMAKSWSGRNYYQWHTINMKTVTRCLAWDISRWNISFGTRPNLVGGTGIETFIFIDDITIDEHCNWLIRAYRDKFKHWSVEWENRLTLRLNTVKNTDYMKKSLKQKLLRIQFPTKNWSGRIRLSLSGVELGGSKDCHV